MLRMKELLVICVLLSYFSSGVSAGWWSWSASDVDKPCNDCAKLYQRDLISLWPKHVSYRGAFPPLIIGVGAEKSGTTSLGMILKANKDAGFFRGNAKEHRFFDCRWRRSLCADRNRRNPTLYHASWRNVASHYKQYAKQWGIDVKCNHITRECVSRNAAWQFTGNLTWDISPGYMPQPTAPYHMREILPRADLVKLIFILREPIHRAISGFWQAAEKEKIYSLMGSFIDDNASTRLISNELKFLRKCYNRAYKMIDGRCRSPEDRAYQAQICMNEHEKVQWRGIDYVPGALFFQDKQAVEPDGSFFHHDGNLYRGIYVDMLKNYLCAGFKPEQILILTTSELKDPAFLKRVADFIGVGEDAFSHNLKKTVNTNGKSHSHRISEELLKELEDFYRPHNKELVEFVKDAGFHVNLDAMEHEFLGY
uniref:Sulfotransferase domain-containing protein n=1 Tax=Timspurckia oligopyrenoides TaxID=708627 RepID=A0A7S0ZDD4_9RHOD